MQSIITFENKVALNENADIPAVNKVRDVDINEIKAIVNGSLQGTNAMGSIVVDDISGKNLFDGSSMIELRNQVRRYSDGVIVSVSGYYGIKVPLKANTTYIVSSDLADRNKISNLCYFNGNTYISGVTFDSGSLSFTTPNNCNYVTLAVSNEYTWLQIELGTEATEYVEFKQPVKKTSIGVKESTTFYADDFKCKNMFIPTMINEGVSINKTNCNLSLVNDEYTFVATGSDMYFGQVTTQNTAYASNKGTLYDVEGLSSISFTITNPLFTTNFITAYDSSKNSLGYTLFNTNTGTYTIPAGAKYITLRAGKNDAVSGTTYKAKIQLEAGSVTTYTPYKNFDNTIYTLWTNSSPSSSFTAGDATLSDSLANYQFYEVLAKTYSSENMIISSGKIPTSFSGELSRLALQLSRYRSFTNGTTKLTFSDAQGIATNASGSATTNNNWLVPYQIIAYK